jgi:hypothetical protein
MLSGGSGLGKAFIVLAVVGGCSGQAFSTASPGGSGGDGAGGAGGGVTNTGGRSSGGATSGGAPSTGGVPGGAGGAPATGGGNAGGAATGGVAASGGAIGNGGAGAGGGTGTCPPTVPNGSCAFEGLKCTYGDCCPTYAECTGGQWQVSAAPCAVPSCPPTPPTDGAPCDCQDAPYCDFDRCDSGGGRARAQCTGEKWKIDPIPCPGQNQCVQIACAQNSYCVQRRLDAQGTFNAECVPWICTDPQAPPCLCIGAACTGRGGECLPLDSGSGVYCTAP